MESLGKVISIEAGEDLSSSTEKVVTLNSSGKAIGFSAITNIPAGILKNAPVTGEAAEIAIDGVSRIWLGGTLSPGALVGASAAGKAVADASTNYNIGVLLKGGADGEIGEVILGSKTATA